MTWTAYSLGSVTSPNFPSDYNNNDNFQQKVTVSGVDRLRLVFSEFTMEEGNDTLKVLDEYVSNGGVVYQTLTGSLGTTKFRSKPVDADVIAWWHQTNSSVTAKGWEITGVEAYVAADTSSIEPVDINCSISLPTPTVSILGADINIPYGSVSQTVTTINPYVLTPFKYAQVPLSINVLGYSVNNSIVVEQGSVYLSVNTIGFDVLKAKEMESIELGINTPEPDVITTTTFDYSNINLGVNLTDYILGSGIYYETKGLNTSLPSYTLTRSITETEKGINVSPLLYDVIYNKTYLYSESNLGISSQDYGISKLVDYTSSSTSITLNNYDVLFPITQSNINKMIDTVPYQVYSIFTPDSVDYVGGDVIVKELNLHNNYSSTPVVGSYIDGVTRTFILGTGCYLGDEILDVESIVLNKSSGSKSITVVLSIDSALKLSLLNSIDNLDTLSVYHYWFQKKDNKGARALDFVSYIFRDSAQLKELQTNTDYDNYSATLKAYNETSINSTALYSANYKTVSKYWELNIDYTSFSISFKTEVNELLEALDSIKIGNSDIEMLATSLDITFSNNDAYMSISGVLIKDGDYENPTPLEDLIAENLGDSEDTETSIEEGESEGEIKTTNSICRVLLDNGSTPFTLDFNSCYITKAAYTTKISVSSANTFDEVSGYFSYQLAAYVGALRANNTASLKLLDSALVTEINVSTNTDNVESVSIGAENPSGIDVENIYTYTNNSISEVSDFWNLSINYLTGAISFDTNLRTDISPIIGVVKLEGNITLIADTVVYKLSKTSSFMSISGVLINDPAGSGIYNRSGENSEIRSELTGVNYLLL